MHVWDKESDPQLLGKVSIIEVFEEIVWFRLNWNPDIIRGSDFIAISIAEWNLLEEVFDNDFGSIPISWTTRESFS